MLRHPFFGLAPIVERGTGTESSSLKTSLFVYAIFRLVEQLHVGTGRHRE